MSSMKQRFQNSLDRPLTPGLNAAKSTPTREGSGPHLTKKYDGWQCLCSLPYQVLLEIDNDR